MFTRESPSVGGSTAAKSPGRAAWLALGLYLGQLLVAPLLHEAAHSSEVDRSGVYAAFDGGRIQSLRAPCSGTCADPDHHHRAAPPDHARTCSTCSALSAPARAEAASSVEHAARATGRAFETSHSPKLARFSRSCSPRAPPTVA